MPTNITQTVSETDGRVTLRVEGDMLLDDALLLEKIAVEMRSEQAIEVTIDLADLDFLDSESAAGAEEISERTGL